MNWKDKERWIWIGVLLVLGLCSMFVVPKLAFLQDIHTNTMQALTDKEMSVTGLTALSSAASVAIAAVPGDATTPIATQISELSTFLLMAVCAIFLEKFLLTTANSITFTAIIPIACAIGIVYHLLKIEGLGKFALKIGLLGFLFWATIPASEYLCTQLETTLQVQESIESAEQNVEDIEEDTAVYEKSGLLGSLSQLGNSLTNGISESVEKAEETLNHIIDSIAILLITSCVMPFLVLMIFSWLLRSILEIDFKSPDIGNIHKSLHSSIHSRKRITTKS